MSSPLAERRSALWAESRLLFSAALLIFIITVVIGILNGTDLLDPGHDTLITHVHAGTLGWITLSVAGAVLLMFTEGRSLSESELRSARQRARAVLITIPVYVGAFWIGMKLWDGILRPIAGTFVFLAVISMLVWLVQQSRRATMTVPKLAALLAWISLLIGALFGVMLGLFTSRGEVPGLARDTAASLAEAHPPTMVIGYLVLAGLGIAEWLLRTEHRPLASSRAGIIQVVLVFLAGLSLLVGLITDSEPFVILNAPLEVAGLAIFIVRLWPELRPSSWRMDQGLFVRFGVLGLIAGVGFLVYLIQGIASGRYETPDDIPGRVIIALDHLNFIGVMTNLTFGLIAASVATLERARVQLVIWGMNLGLVGFVIGLSTDSSAIKRVSTPVMGLAILFGIWLLFSALRAEQPEPVMVA
jgi:hypothetical protein